MVSLAMFHGSIGVAWNRVDVGQFLPRPAAFGTVHAVSSQVGLGIGLPDEAHGIRGPVGAQAGRDGGRKREPG